MIGWLYFRISSTAAKNVAGISFSGCFLQKPEKFTPDSSYTADGATPEYYTSSLMTKTTSGGTLTGYTVQYPSGATDYYNFVLTDTTGTVLCYRTQQVDAAGHATQFVYNTDINNITRLQSVIDADGLTTTISYANTSYPTRITGVTDAFGRAAALYYNASGLLTNVTDVVGISSQFAYDTNLWITNLTTPYGTTVFSYTDINFATNDVIDRAVMVSDALGGTNLYVYRAYASFLNTTAYTLPQQPGSAPSISTNRMSYQNSWHWGPLQFSALSTGNMNSFTAADYNKGRLINWLSDSSGANANDAINMKQSVSPDGTLQGEQVWYAYDGEFTVSGLTYKGTDAKPALAAAILPDGNSWYQWTQRNSVGNITNILDTWSQGFQSTVNIRSNQFFYAINGIDIVQQIGPLGETVLGCSYDSSHNVLTATNAAGEITTNTYDSQSRLTSVRSAAGLTTTNIYFASGQYTNRVQQQIDLQINRTNTYSYANGLVLT
jgi:YD repeat-containing protein